MMETLDAAVDPRFSALVIVDVQNDYCHDDGALSRAGRHVAPVREMVPRLQEVLRRSRASGVYVIHVRMANTDLTRSEAYREQRRRRSGRERKVCEEGSWGAEFYEIEPLASEPVVTKHRYSAFFGTALETLLKVRSIRTMVLAGVTTDVCVEATARDAFMRDYDVIVLSDCTGLDDEDVQKATLTRIDRYFGRVSDSEQITGAWARGL